MTPHPAPLTTEQHTALADLVDGMAAPTTLDRIKISLLCPICNCVTLNVWMSPIDIGSLAKSSEFDQDAYIRPHYNCAYHIDPDAALPQQPRTAGPDAAERRRTSGAVHTDTWRSR